MAKGYRKFAKRQFRRGRRALRRRYVNKRGNLRVGRISRDVARLKMLVNVEKKDHSGSESAINFALSDSLQTLGRGDALYKLSGPVQGTTATTRVGNSIRISSINMALRIQGQASLTDVRNYCIYFLQYAGVPDPAKDSTAGTADYDNTLILDFLEYNSDGRLNEMCFRTKETFRNWRILKVIKGRLGAQMYSSGGEDFRTYNFFLKPFKGMEHLKFDDNDSDPLQNPIYMFLTSTGGDTNSNTGLRTEFDYRINYIDN